MTTLDDRARHERMAIDEALVGRLRDRAARRLTPADSIPRKLGDELIAAGIETVSAYEEHNRRKLRRAIDRLKSLVGGGYP